MIPVLNHGDFKVVEIGAADVHAEADALRNCLANYGDRLRDRQCRVYVVKDGAGRSRAAIEVVGSEVIQAKGKANALPQRTCLPIMRRFLRELDLNVVTDHWAFDLMPLGQGRYVDLYETCPHHALVEGNLVVPENYAGRLPVVVRVHGSFLSVAAPRAIYPSTIQAFEDVEIIGAGRLSMIEVTARRDVNLSRCTFVRFPTTLSVGRSLYLHKAKGVSLSPALRVPGHCDLTGSDARVSGAFQAAGRMALAA
jgi:hypothetical protein